MYVWKQTFLWISFFFQRHRPQGPPSGPPPPYPGPRPTAPPAPGPAIAGPSHGYGEGRGHYNRRDKSQMPQSTRNKNRIDDHAYVYSKGTAIEMRGKAYAWPNVCLEPIILMPSLISGYVIHVILYRTSQLF